MSLYKRLICLIVSLLLLICATRVCAEEPSTIYLPKGYGSLHTYTVWDKINWGGNCKRLKTFAEDQGITSNNYGIVTYGGYFCGALTSTYGKVGDMMLIVQEDNVVYPVIMADTKNQSDSGCNKWGHQGGKCVVEFEILSSYRKSLYGTSGGYISDALAKPIVKVINLGSIYDSTEYLFNPNQACLDNGLDGYVLLSTPYTGDMVKQQFDTKTVSDVEPQTDEIPKETGLFNRLINWLKEIIS